MSTLYSKTKFLKMFSTGDKIDIGKGFIPRCPECKELGIIDGYYSRGSNTGKFLSINLVDDFYCICHKCNQVHEFYFIGDRNQVMNRLKMENWEHNSYEI